MTRLISTEERFEGDRVTLRLLTLADCNEQYVAWLRDPEVNRYLETRWTEQTIDTVVAFVSALMEDPLNYLFAIVENDGGAHVGNLKIGLINVPHGYADLSYFIGARECWGRGYASDAIALASAIGFGRLGLHRLQAGLYERNLASARSLVKAGFQYEARFRRQLVGPEGFEDHVWYARFSDSEFGR